MFDKHLVIWCDYTIENLRTSMLERKKNSEVYDLRLVIVIVVSTKHIFFISVSAIILRLTLTCQ